MLRCCLVLRLEVGSATGNCRCWHQFPDPHVVQVIVKLLSALKTGDVGISGWGPGLMDRRYRSGDLPVAATTQQVQHCFDHAFTLQTESGKGNSCPRVIVIRGDDEDQYSQQLNAKG